MTHETLTSNLYTQEYQPFKVLLNIHKRKHILIFNKNKTETYQKKTLTIWIMGGKLFF